MKKNIQQPPDRDHKSETDLPLLQAKLKRMEEANCALEAKISALESMALINSSDLEAARGALVVCNQELGAFAYSVSHDLRAPLRGIQGFSTILLEDYAPVLEEAGCEFISRINRAAQQMEGLIQDLLGYSRLHSAELLLTSLDLHAVIAQSSSLQSTPPNHSAASLEVSPKLPSVRGHQATLVLVFTQLISNAVKFVPAGRAPQVCISAELRDDKVRVWVMDNGIGIAPEHHEKIFRVFERLHGTESYPGTGIGLALVAKGMQRMGGSAGVESTPGKGSQFWIELPKA